nr:MAG TPA: hypothetical protein [Caudoviricetes sp.]
MPWQSRLHHAMRTMSSSSAALKRCLKAPLTRWKNMLPRHLKMSA